MNITWEMIEKYQITWEDIDALNLTWAELETMSSENVLAIAKQRLPRFQTTDDPLPKESAVVIEKLYVQFPESAPKQEKYTTKALAIFGSALLSKAASDIIDHWDDIACAVMKVIALLARSAN